MNIIANPLIFQDNYSPGCQLCQNGRWLCIYLTYLCSAQCQFCPAPYKATDKIVSAFGDEKETILKWINRGQFQGISFSGGDCLLVFDRLLNWLQFFRKQRPDIYYWAYTNGLAADYLKLGALAQAGLNEIRFNIAATGYQHPEVLQQMSLACQLFEHVTVEIPSIPRHFNLLSKVLPELWSCGVKFLNLHEYLLVANDPYSKQASSGTFLLNKLDKIKYDAYSLQNTERIRKFCLKNGIGLHINNCSLQKKESQIKQRRLVMGKILKKSFESLTDEGLLETLLVIPHDIAKENLEVKLNDEPETLSAFFVNPAEVKVCDFLNNHLVYKIQWLPPLALDEKRRLLHITTVKP